MQSSKRNNPAPDDVLDQQRIQRPAAKPASRQITSHLGGAAEVEVANSDHRQNLAEVQAALRNEKKLRVKAESELKSEKKKNKELETALKEALACLEKERDDRGQV